MYISGRHSLLQDRTDFVPKFSKPKAQQKSLERVYVKVHHGGKETIKPRLLDELMLSRDGDTSFESAQFVKHFKGKAIAANKHHFANRRKKSGDKVEQFSIYEPDYM